MKRVQVKDKAFKIFIESEKILEAVSKVAESINKDYKGKNPLFIVVLNGAFMFASDLFKKLNLDCEVSFVKLSSYQGTKSTEIVRELIGLDEDIEGRDIVLVEDIIDTGITMEKTLNQLHHLNPASIKIATLLYKPNAFVKDFPIDYIGIEIPNDFIIGYGLDYDGYARNLADIYTLEN